jgi:hypothetical protein
VCKETWLMNGSVEVAEDAKIINKTLDMRFPVIIKE